MEQWGLFTLEGDPYPPNEFLPGELYVWPGGGEWDGFSYPEDAGLVMYWGDPSIPPGEYSSALMYDYLEDPDLSNAQISVTVTAPQFDPFGNQINVVSFGIQDVNGFTRAWYWNVGQLGPIPWNTPATITINTAVAGIGAATPAASSYMNTPGFDITKAQLFIVDENATWVGGPMPVPPPGMIIPGMWNYWHNLIVSPGGTPGDIKWEQLPEPGAPENLFYGWNELSWFDGPQIVADDWVCLTPDPVTDLHWWGSFLDWKHGELPPHVPDHFHFAIWTDVPAGADENFSHPGEVIWEADCFDFTVEFVGWDFDPIKNQYEAAFRFEQDLNPEQWFFQPGDQSIFWLSISAVYADGVDVEHPWGWKTRPRDAASPAPDDAVVVFAPTVPHIGAEYISGGPLWWPTPETSWDMAFELTATPTAPSAKWEQIPDLSPNGIDVNATFSPFMPPYVLADDFQCTMTGPILEIDVWGSWLFDHLPFGGDPMGLMFRLSLHKDIPANQSPTGYSMPGEQLWMREFSPGQFIAEPFAFDLMEGWLDPPASYMPFADSQCWLYRFLLFPDEFIQEGTPDTPVVYWLDVQAFPFDEQALFGWKTSVVHWNDDAVWAFGEDPFVSLWEELRYPPEHPQQGQSIDLAFAIRGESGSLIKWSQPPIPFEPQDGFLGWNEVSWFGGPQIVADDWLCDTSKPVTDLHWWGSFLNWDKPEPPLLPDAFHIAIWTDVPAGFDVDFSHPGVVVWETYCHEYTWEFVGWDFDVRDPTIPPETCFKFEQLLNPEEFFYQDEECGIYWLSISAIWPDDVIDHPWGWKTRPRDPNSPVPDDAVVVFDPTVPLPGSQYMQGGPIWWPTPDDSWDVAFVLTTQEEIPEACCMTFAEPACTDVPPTQCVSMQGVPQGAGTSCTLPEACCLPDGTCMDVDPLCCDDLGGQPSPIGEPNCLGDFDGNGVDDACEPPTPLESKWSQLPHEPGMGFDAISDLWWATEEFWGIKWLQWPDHNWSGLHDVAPMTLADDWLCDGGDATDFHWWGNYELDEFGMEKRGDGIMFFHLSIHADAGGLPLEPPLWQLDVPFAETQEHGLQLVNIEGGTVYLYGYELPEPFMQQQGQIYWFDVSAIPNNPNNPPQWRWQEAGRKPIDEIRLNPAASKTAGIGWQSITWDNYDPTLYSELAFMVTTIFETQEYVNKVVADDFISDGRPIRAIKWWGSYWDTNFLPDFFPQIQSIDGWLITFHWSDPPEDPSCPPDVLLGDSPTALGTYFAPADAVQKSAMFGTDCFGHQLYEYSVNLEDCCLVCSETDPRFGAGIEPAQEGAFVEVGGWTYWMSIQAVTGALWIPPECPFVFTGGLPSLLPGNDGHYWGWHTSPANEMEAGPLREACTGRIFPPFTFPAICWNYGDWMMQPWQCEPFPPDARVDMAFELLAEECPEATISGSLPTDGTVDARQPHPPADNSPAARQGIGSAAEPIIVMLDGPVLGAASCFQLCETAVDPLLGANWIESVTELRAAGHYAIVLHRPITTGAVTTIMYTGDGSYVEFISHPANVNADGVAGGADVLALINMLNNQQVPPYGAYSMDVDHSGVAGGPDVLRTIDLLNGANLFDPWNLTLKPVNGGVCP